MSSLFQNLQAISPLGENTLRAIEQCLRTERHGKQQILVRDGEPSDKMYFLLKGGARAYFHYGDKEFTDWFVFEDMFMCAISAFYGGGASTQVIETLEPSEMLVLRRRDIEALCDTYPDFQKLHGKILSQSLVILQQNIIDQRFKTAPERYRELLIRYPQALQRVPLKHIASFLGVTQETLSRIRSNLIS